MTDQHKHHYSDQAFWAKVGDCFKAAGRGVIFNALTLYFCLQDPDTPPWAKAIIVGALGYLISPLDVIPDFTPFIGYTDDAGVLAGAVLTLAAFITDDHRNRANGVLHAWFG